MVISSDQNRRPLALFVDQATPLLYTSLIETFRVRHYSLKKIVGATQGQMNKVAVAFKVDSNEKGIFELENMQALDDRENPVPWMAPGPFNFYDPNFEEGLDGEIIAYLQEENDTEHLTISRELKVTPDRRIEVEFPDGKPA